MKLSVFMPFYNEEKRLQASLETVYGYLLKKIPEGNLEFLLVNDGSSDNSLAIAQSFTQVHPEVRLISHDPPNLGKGFAVKKGMLESRGDWVCFLDTDLATPIEELDKFLPYFANFDIVIGTRRVKEAQVEVRQPFYREALGKVFYYMTRVILGLRVSDVTCGFKCYSRRAADEIFKRQTLDDWSYDAEDLFLAQKLEFSVKEVPVVWRNRDQSRVRVLKDAVYSLKGLAKIRLLHGR